MKKREIWLDNVKGLCALFVILNHTPYTIGPQMAFIAYIMIPGFFWVSGYLCHYEGLDPGKYIYNRVGKLLVLYVFYGLVLPFASVSVVHSLLEHPSEAIYGVSSILTKAILDIAEGKAFWFLACLISVNLIFIVIQTIAKGNRKKLLLESLSILVVGWILTYMKGAGMTYWSYRTAFICQFFFTVGFVIRDTRINKVIKNPVFKAAGWFILYGVAIWVIGTSIGFDRINISVANNRWGNLFLTIPLLILGNIAMIYLAKAIKKDSMLSFIGEHSLLYFAIASHGMSIANKVIEKIYRMTKLPVLANRGLINPVICVMGALLILPICYLTDRYVPFVNGKFKMPRMIRKSE